MEDTKLKEAFAAVAKDRNKRDALAAIITEFVQPNHIAVDFMSMLLDSRSLQPGDSLVVKQRKGMKVRTLVPGSIHLGSEITVTERMNYVLDGANIKVGWGAWDMESGEIGTLSDIRGEMAAKMRDYFMNKIFTALTTVWTAANTPDNFTQVATAVTATALEDAIDNINQTAGGVKAVVGIRSLMTPITKFGAFWDNGSGTTVGVDGQLAEVVARGSLGRYYGAPLIALNQQWDNPEDHNTLLPTDKILVIGNNVGDFITYGDVRTKMWDDMAPTPPYTWLEMYQQFGLLISKAEGIHVIKIV